MTAAPAAKPPYTVPTMRQVRAVPDNGWRVASLFSGSGGSSLGYRLAGFRVAYANEFVEAARETYLANSPKTYVDDRDVRTVTGEFIFHAAGTEIDLLDGSPPCASFSVAGLRHDAWGESKKYSDTKQRTDDLFDEYVRIVGELRPKVFVAENVAGLVKGPSKGIFLEVLAALRRHGYRVEARVLNAAYLGVPQSRARLFFLGVRNDLGLDPVFPKPLPYVYTIRDVLPAAADGAPQQIVRAGRGGRDNWGENWGTILAPVGTLGASPSTGAGRSPASTVVTLGPPPFVDPETGADIAFKRVRNARRLTLPELRLVSSFPADFVLTGTYAQRWERVGRAVPPLMMRAIAETVRDEILGRIE